MSTKQQTEASADGGHEPSRRKRYWKYGVTALVALVIGLALAQPDPETRTVTKTTTQTVTAPSPQAAAKDALESEVADLKSAAKDARRDAKQARSDARSAARDQRAAERRSEGRLAKLRSQASGVRTEIAHSQFDGDGTFLVNDDIAPGTYKADSSGESCYWERTSQGGDIIDNDNTDGPAVIVVAPTDFSVSTARCGAFQKVGG
jgi:hypothetical protein